MPSVRNVDPFNAVMLASEPLNVTVEQSELVKKVLAKACSDSRFAEKAYLAIWRILTFGSVVPPVVTSLNPGSATVGDPSFTLHVIGTGFTPESKIIFNGGEEPTVYVSATELTTGVDMSTVTVGSSVPVSVQTGDVVSDPVNFVFQDVALLAAMASKTPAPVVAKPAATTPTTAVKK